MKDSITKIVSLTMFTITVLLLSSKSYAGNSVECMAKAIYFEARGSSTQDMLAVGHTIQNRVRSSRYPNNICSVTNARSQYSPHIRRGTPIRNRQAYNKALELASSVINGNSKDFTNGATNFHNRTVNPRWATPSRRVYSNRYHIYYKIH